jgi:hypothetical protein
MDAAMSSRLHPASISAPARFAISDFGSGEPSGIVQSVLGVVIVVPLLVSVVSEVSGLELRPSWSLDASLSTVDAHRLQHGDSFRIIAAGTGSPPRSPRGGRHSRLMLVDCLNRAKLGRGS